MAAARALPDQAQESRPLIAITMFGVTTPGVLRVERRLREAGFETITFHAVGTGGRAMEEMIEAGTIDGVIDYTVSELTDELLGGIFPAGPHRLEAAGRAGIPQVVVPGAIEVLNFGPRATVPPGFDVPSRRLIVHNENVCAVRTTRGGGRRTRAHPGPQGECSHRPRRRRAAAGRLRQLPEAAGRSLDRSRGGRRLSGRGAPRAQARYPGRRDRPQHQRSRLRRCGVRAVSGAVVGAPQRGPAPPHDPSGFDRMRRPRFAVGSR